MKSESKFLNIRFPGWDVGKSLQTLLENAKESSTHLCAKFIRQALNAGGISTPGNPSNALEYHTKDYLHSLGFIHVKTLESAQEANNYKPLPGDIAIMYSPIGDNGHICMYTGAEWVSDFVQNKMRPYISTGANPETIWIWRWDCQK